MIQLGNTSTETILHKLKQVLLYISNTYTHIYVYFREKGREREGKRERRRGGGERD